MLPGPPPASPKAVPTVTASAKPANMLANTLRREIFTRFPPFRRSFRRLTHAGKRRRRSERDERPACARSPPAPVRTEHPASRRPFWPGHDRRLKELDRVSTATRGDEFSQLRRKIRPRRAVVDRKRRLMQRQLQDRKPTRRAAQRKYSAGREPVYERRSTGGLDEGVQIACRSTTRPSAARTLRTQFASLPSIATRSRSPLQSASTTGNEIRRPLRRPRTSRVTRRCWP